MNPPSLSPPTKDPPSFKTLLLDAYGDLKAGHTCNNSDTWVARVILKQGMPVVTVTPPGDRVILKQGIHVITATPQETNSDNGDDHLHHAHNTDLSQSSLSCTQH